MPYCISDVGLILDILAVALLAKFNTPSEILDPSGRDSMAACCTPEEVKANIKKYQRYRRVSLFAYSLLCFGFILQLSITTQVLSNCSLVETMRSVLTNQFFSFHSSCSPIK